MDELFFLNERGWILGPDETAEELQARVTMAKSRYESGEWIGPAHWDFVSELLDHLFHVKPLYICAYYSNKGLAPWQGGACWTEGKRLHSIQLRKPRAWLYNKEEILAHEAVHAARAGFNEDRYEEFFAYMTADVKWKQVLGPIIQRPWEVWPLFITLFLGALWPISYLAATLWTALGFIRLIKGHRTLAKASAQILKETNNEKSTRAILFRLAAQEIEGLGRGQTVASYANSRHDLRWKLIHHYLDGTWQKKSL